MTNLLDNIVKELKESYDEVVLELDVDNDNNTKTIKLKTVSDIKEQETLEVLHGPTMSMIKKTGKTGMAYAVNANVEVDSKTLRHVLKVRQIFQTGRVFI